MKTELRLVIDESKVNKMESRIKEMGDKLSSMEALLKNFSKFSSYPKWLTKDQAFEILPFKSDYELNKWVSRGVIQSKSISARIKTYLKSDCIDFPEKAEAWRIRMTYEPEKDSPGEG